MKRSQMISVITCLVILLSAALQASPLQAAGPMAPSVGILGHAPPPIGIRDLQDLHVVGDLIRIKLAGSETGQPFSVIEEETPPNGGPPLHRHSREDEAFYVIEGEFEFRIGEAALQPEAGTYILAPRGIPHTFKNIGETTGRVMATISPPGFEKFFVEVDALGETATRAELLELAESFGLEMLAP